MVRVAWMKNCGGKRGRERAGAGGGPWEGSGAWKKLDGAKGGKQVCFWSFSGAVGGEAGREVVASESEREKINAKKASEALCV